ncbi:MAG TPA: ABC transporter permease [Candidatus Aquilonibacter sp.]|nr:ABC transporter permease [Candidatus Aquilonibacter sp.]
MNHLREWWKRAAGFFHKERRDAELEEELASHLEMLVEENVEQGMGPEEARRAARIAFGGGEQIKEVVREQRGLPFLESLIADVRFGLRMLRKNPGFTATAILTLALGIGANTAIFSAVNGILLRPLPFARPAQLYAIHEFVPQFSAFGPSIPVNGGNFLAWKKESDAFSSMALIDAEGAGLLGMGRPQWLYGAAVTPGFFSVFGVRPFMGRAFSGGDEPIEAKPEIILTHWLWREEFHSDPNILGKIVELGGRGLTVVGVLPANFGFPRILTHDPQYLVPFPWAQWNSKPGIGTHDYFVVARLREGTRPKQAEAELDAIESRIAEKDSGGQFNLYAILTPLKTEIVGSTRQALWMLTVAAGLVLLVVCANLANLLLTKNSTRVREVALRSAFGAGRWRLARQFFTETLLLASAGGFLGVIFAKFALWRSLRTHPLEFL